jgi:hypothetical protein
MDSTPRCASTDDPHASLVGSERGIEQDWLGVAMFFDGIGATGTAAPIEAAGLVIDNAEQVIEDEGQGNVVQLLWVLARRPVR